MKNHIQNKKELKRSGIPWMFLVLTVFLLSAVTVSLAIPQSLAAQVTMEVYQQEGHKVFGQETSLDIFNDAKLGGKKYLHPYSEGSYTFAVYNSSNSAPLPYSLNITGTNLDNIPLVFSLQKDGEYLFGGENLAQMLPLSEVNLAEKLLDGKKTDLYTLNWAWKSESDLADTTMGDIGTQLYKLVISATGTAAPDTGHTPNTSLWAIVMLASIALIFVLIVFRRKKDTDEKNNPTVSACM